MVLPLTKLGIKQKLACQRVFWISGIMLSQGLWVSRKNLRRWRNLCKFKILQGLEKGVHSHTLPGNVWELFANASPIFQAPSSWIIPHSAYRCSPPTPARGENLGQWISQQSYFARWSTIGTALLNCFVNMNRVQDNSILNWEYRKANAHWSWYPSERYISRLPTKRDPRRNDHSPAKTESPFWCSSIQIGQCMGSQKSEIGRAHVWTPVTL